MEAVRLIDGAAVSFLLPCAMLERMLSAMEAVDPRR